MSDESFPGYVLRLAMENGWASSSEFLNALGTSGQVNIRADNKKLVNYIIEITGHNKNHISKSRFMPHGDTAFVRIVGNVFESLNLHHVQVCPLCMTNSAYHRSQWQYLPYTHCIEHKQSLIHKCTICDAPFEWYSSLLSTGCGQCGQIWGGMVTPNIDIPKYLKVLLEYEYSYDYLSDLMTAAQRIIRPFDELIDRVQRLPSGIKDWTPILEQAYLLLTDIDFALSWVSQCGFERKDIEILGIKALYSPAQRLIGALECADWPISSIELGEFVKQGKSQLTPLLPSQLPSRQTISSSNNDMQYHTDIEGLDAVIGCQDSDSLILVKNGLLTPLNDKRRYSDSLYDVRKLMEIVTQFRTIDKARKMSSLSSYEYLFKFFNVQWQDVILAIFTCRLEVSINTESKDTLLTRLHVSKFSLLRFMVTHLRNQADNDIQISKESVCSILAVSADELKRLAKAGILTPIEYNNYGRAYHLKECTVFMKNYWSLNRWAAIHRICKTDLLEYIEQQDIKSSISRYFYAYSHDLKIVLSNYKCVTLRI